MSNAGIPFGAGEVQRVRFAPTPPANCNHSFFHLGHLSSLILAREEAVKRQCEFHIRIDDTCGPLALLDIWNCCNHFGILVDHVYFMSKVTAAQVAFHTTADLSKFTDTEISMAFDDMIEHPNTIIVRGMEFQSDKIKPRMFEVYCAFCEYREANDYRGGWIEVNTPLVTVSGAKMRKSATRDNAILWTTLRKYDPELVALYFIAKAKQFPNSWEWSFEDFLGWRPE